MMKNTNRASMYLLLKSKDTIINMLVLIILSIALFVAVSFGILNNKENSEMILILFILVLGTTMLVANSMIVDLTVKDKLSNRLEFFLASNIRFRDILISYTIQIFRLASIIPFFLFMMIYYFIDFSQKFSVIVILYITTVLLAFSGIFALNVFSFIAKKYKLFKNFIFFGTFLLIYLVGMFSNNIVQITKIIGIDIAFCVIGINIVLSILICGISTRKLKSMDNEDLIKQKGEWV